MQRDLPALTGREFDVVVVGGGICGAVIAWDAAQRGLFVALIERGDFGAATSANSLKVVHGGMRYLPSRRWDGCEALTSHPAPHRLVIVRKA